MSNLNILSGGAAQGLVGSLAPAFKAQTGFDIAGEFGAVGAMADKLRKGMPTDIVILTAALLAKLAEEKLVVAASIADVGLVETALAVRAGDPRVVAPDEARSARGAAGLGRHLRAGHQGLDGRDSRRQGAGTARHRRCGRRAAEDLSERRDRDARTGGVGRAASDRLHAVDRDHRDQGRRAVRIAAAGMRARDHVHGRRHDKGRPSVPGSSPDRLA